jgi:hypothetical protein
MEKSMSADQILGLVLVLVDPGLVLTSTVLIDIILGNFSKTPINEKISLHGPETFNLILIK